MLRKLRILILTILILVGLVFIYMKFTYSGFYQKLFIIKYDTEGRVYDELQCLFLTRNE